MMLTALGIILIVTGTLGTVIPILPGSPIALAGFILIAWVDNFTKVGWSTLTVITVLTVIGLVFDIVATHYGVKKAGASKLGLTGAMVGIFFGLFLGPIGILIGPMMGAIVGELIHQQKLFRAGGIGLAAGASIIASLIIKIGLLLISVLIFVWDYLQ